MVFSRGLTEVLGGEVTMMVYCEENLESDNILYYKGVIRWNIVKKRVIR